mmetsp:Transcript_32079/g.51384  ORF Transcript_32079/g.51384 Transcript_32079/m.51384 type:complete len:142 (+) Transcript_32079:640-1065(+)
MPPSMISASIPLRPRATVRDVRSRIAVAPAAGDGWRHAEHLAVHAIEVRGDGVPESRRGSMVSTPHERRPVCAAPRMVEAAGRQHAAANDMCDVICDDVSSAPCRRQSRKDGSVGVWSWIEYERRRSFDFEAHKTVSQNTT